jgi:NitT/TauT family transport system substrate-binding protein
MKVRPMRASWFSCAAAALIAFGAGAFPLAGAADGPTVIRLQQLRGDDGANAFYAQDLGYFKNAGLDVQISMVSSGPVAAQAVASGAADIGTSNVATIAAARARGISLCFIAPSGIASERTLEVVIMVPKDSPVKTAADLNRKTFGVNAVKAMPQLGAQTWMDKNGGDSKTVKFVEIPFPSMGAALESHRIDAAVVAEPFASQDKGVARSLGSANSGLAPNVLILGFFASDDWLATHADAASRFVRALRQAAEWGNSHHAESAVILSRYNGMDVSVIKSMVRAEYGLVLDPATIDPVVQSAAKYGMIEKAVPVSDLIWKNPNP